jgi:hypothetical protein
MKAGLSWAVLLLCLSSGQSGAVAQRTPAQLTVAVVVADAHTEPAQPVPMVRVSLGYLDGSVLVTEARDVTNPKGQAWLDVSEDAVQRGGLRIEINGANNLVIYQPADGQVTVPPTAFTVKLLPKGSPALLGPAQIEAILHRTLLEVNSLQQQVSALKQTVAAQNQDQKFDAAIAEWAENMGFPSGQVQQQIQIWTQNIELQSSQATAEQKALAELAQKHYAAAAQGFGEAAEATQKQIDADEAAAAAQVDKARDGLRKLIDEREQAAGADQLNLQYHLATQSLEGAESTADSEYKKHPEDRGFRQLWLLALFDVTKSRWKEGEVSPADRSVPLLAKSGEGFQSLAREYSQLGDPREGAIASDGLGVVLYDEGVRLPGDKSVALLDQSVQAFQNASEVLTKESYPKEWANTQENLGNALRFEGDRAGGDKAIALLSQAAQACNRALEVFTKADAPVDWADTQTNLGNALYEEGIRSSAARAVPLLNQAADAYRNALQVYNKTDSPRLWAGVQANLSAALDQEASFFQGAQARALFEQATQASQTALEVYTRVDLPQDWARTENNLCNMLGDEASAASAEDAPSFAQKAVEACQNALQVYTKADLPQNWAQTQVVLGYNLWLEALRSGPTPSSALLEQSVQAYRHALEIYTQKELPLYWAWTQDNLAAALADEAIGAGKDQSAALITQALQSYQNLADVFTSAAFPRVWATLHISLAELNLWAGRYNACLQNVTGLPDDALSPPQILTRDATKLACQWGAGPNTSASATEKTLLKEAASQSGAAWDSQGTAYFLSTLPEFAKGRASWIALFTAVQNGDAAGMTAALHQLEPILQQ